MSRRDWRNFRIALFCAVVSFIACGGTGGDGAVPLRSSASE